MEHRGYVAEIRYSQETDRFQGHVLNIEPRDLVLFDGASVDELRANFVASIEDHEEALREAGREPRPLPYPAGVEAR